MARQPKVEIALLADAGAMVRGFRQAGEAADDFDGKTSKVSKAVGIMDKAVVGAAAALGGGFVIALKTGISSLMEHEKADAQTAAAIKSTGGAAKVTAGQISTMADAIEKKSGIDDVAIKQGANLLLTFTKIRNEAGKGNDIFNQTTSIMADVATALGKDPTSAAMMLGKALNDPVKGVSALGRAGVQFSKEQKDLIKDMVESGNVMGAQKMILKELETQFGGSADAAGKTFSGRLNILKARLEEVAEAVALKVMPFLMAFMAWVERNWPQIEAAFNAIADAVFTVGKTVYDIVSPALQALFGFFKENKEAAVALVAVLASLYAGFKLLEIARSVAAAVQLLNLAFLANPVVAVVAAIVALGAALVIAYKKSEEFRDIVNGVGSALRDFFQPIVEALWPVIQRVFTAVRGVVVPVLSAIKLAIEALGALLQGDFGEFVSKLGEALRNLLVGGLRLMLALPQIALDIAVSVGRKILTSLVSGFATIGSAIWEKVTAIPQYLLDRAVELKDGLIELGKKIVEFVVQGIKSLPNVIGSALFGGIDTGGGVPGQNPLTDIIKQRHAEWVARRDAAFSGFKGTPAQRKAQQRRWLENNPEPPKLARGGIVSGPLTAIIGEAGREAVIPLDNATGINALADAMTMAGGGGMTVNLTFNGVLDAKDAARMLRPELDRLVRLAV